MPGSSERAWIKKLVSEVSEARDRAHKLEHAYGEVEQRIRELEWDNSTLRTERVAAIASATLGLAQTLRLIRDSCPSSAASGMAAGALERAGIEDPEDDCDVF